VSWSGTFKTRAVLTKDGKRLDVCALKRVTWSATAVSVPETPEAPIAPETPPEGRR
jgi:hypothetical protein